jgi:Inward rectifier potassium channel C-terminal domain/Ion channel
MALLRKLNTKAKTQINTGFGTNTSDYGGRFVNKNGQANVQKKGVSFLQRTSWYHTMLAMPRWKFLTLIVLFYISVNLLFAGIYLAADVENLNGVNGGTVTEKFWQAFFFSAQTLTTVGYGHVSPGSFLMSSIAAVEALVGLLTLAIITSLLYGRFAKPTAYLKFSENAVIAPYKDITGFMLRVAPFKNTTLTDAEAKLTVGMAVEENGKTTNKFFPLTLEFEKVNALNLSWTIVHPINEESPFYNFTKEDFENAQGEILVFVKAFDDMFSNTVVARSSYTFKEIVYGAKFIPMYHRSNNADATVLDLEKINSFAAANITAANAAQHKTAN